VRQAAIIASRWKLDIVAVLDETDDLSWACRVAGHQILYQMEEAEAAKAKQ
jgi:hypothetical protein